MTSDCSWAEASGTLRGKDRLRMYWSKAFQLLPNLHFELIDTYVSPDSIVVFYQNERPTYEEGEPALANGAMVKLPFKPLDPSILLEFV